MALLEPVAYYALLEIFIFLAFAEILYEFARRVGLPQILSGLIAGMVLGTFALGAVFNQLLGTQLFVVNSYVLLLADFSIILILFAAGLSVGFSSLRRTGLSAIFAAIAGDLIPFFVALVIFSRFYSIQSAALLAVAIGATSSAVAASLVQTEAVAETLGANFLINTAALDDVVALILLSVVLTVIGGRFDIIAVTGNTAEAVAGWVILLLASVLIVPRVLKIPGVRASSHAPFTILFALIAIVTAIGFSAIIGAFIAGIAVAESLVAQRTRQITQVLLAVFGSLFFVVIGAEFDIRLLLNPLVVGLGLTLAGIAIGGKLLGVYPFARFRLGNASDATTVSVGMIPRGEIGLIVGAIGLSQGVLTQAQLGGVLLMATATIVIGAVLFRRRVSSLRSSAPAAAPPLPPSAEGSGALAGTDPPEGAR